MTIAERATAGTDFITLEPQVPVRTDGPVVVVEFFWYASPTCGAIEPALRDWLASTGGDVQFRRVPVNFDPRPTSMQSYGPLQRLHYALESLRLLDKLHQVALTELEDCKLGTDSTVVAWATRHGVDRDALTAAMGSVEVAAKCTAATQMMMAYRIDSVPRIAVAGKYVTGPALLGEHDGYDRTFAVVDTMVAEARG